MKILLVSTAGVETPPTRYGGMERAVCWLADGLKELGHEVIVIAKIGSNYPGTLTGETERDFAKTAEDYVGEADVLIDMSHDKVVARAFKDAIPQFSVWQVMVVTYDHNPVFISAAQRAYIGRNNAPVGSYGLNLDEYPLYEGPREDYLLFMGSVITEKRPHWVAELGKLANLPVIICGPKWDDKYWPILEEMEAMEHVTYLGDVGGAEKLELLQKAKCLVHPVGAKDWVEAGAIVVLEALACGTPVIATRNGCIPEYVTDYINGFMAQSVNDMNIVLKYVENIPPLRCRQSMQNIWNHRAMARRYEHLARRVINGESW